VCRRALATCRLVLITRGREDLGGVGRSGVSAAPEDSIIGPLGKLEAGKKPPRRKNRALGRESGFLGPFRRPSALNLIGV